MNDSNEHPGPALSAIPSVDRVLRFLPVTAMIDAHGRTVVMKAVRIVLDDMRAALAAGTADAGALSEDRLTVRIGAQIDAITAATFRPVFNLTGTVLHTNLGRAPLPADAIAAIAEIASGASNLEFDNASGRRGDRDSHVEPLICRLTGAEAATVVNNNAAAVLLVLNTLALRREVPVSRGELIEIGGAFRMPDIMTRAGCKLREVGTTNRTHGQDYADAIGRRTALLMKVHTSNYLVQGFTAAVSERDLAAIAHDHGLPLVVDLGSGSLVDLRKFSLPYEPTVADTLANGADLVTFSGDKLLGGPQAGLIAGRADLIARIKRNPLKRALRLDKLTIAALAAVLRLYLDPDRVSSRIPTLALLTRATDEIEALALRVAPQVRTRLGEIATLDIEPCLSQIGSGSLPVERLASFALVVRPHSARRGRGTMLDRIAAAFRALPVPVIGRVQDDAFVLDLRCLSDEAGFVGQLPALSLNEGATS